MLWKEFSLDFPKVYFSRSKKIIFASMIPDAPFNSLIENNELCEDVFPFRKMDNN